MVSQRSYLSIGDVLSLLREEFPDVTISKIRFLESQGLVDPERSPSGYRKFYEHDVARLRWVLRAQRDQFLPLKVIRDRLAAAGDGVPPDEEWPVPEADGEADPASPKMARAAGRGTSNGGGRGRSVPSTSGPASSQREQDVVPELATRDEELAVSGAPARAQRPSDTGHGVATAEPRHAANDPAEAAPQGRPAEATAVAPSAPTTHSVSLSGVSLTLPELCAATGLAEQTVASLESLGLIAPVAVAGGAFYDEEALMVGKLAAEFARFGIEPRHLRLYRNAVDREVGLVEQVVTPLLRQRNPEARQKAVEAASELTRLGQNLRASLVRTALRQQLGS